MIYIGPISSIFDIVTYLVMWHVFGCNSPEHQSLFQSGWFIEAFTNSDCTHDTYTENSVHTEPCHLARNRYDYFGDGYRNCDTVHIFRSIHWFAGTSIELLPVAGGYSALLLRADSIGKELVYQKVFGLVIKESPAFLLCQTILADEKSRAIVSTKLQCHYSEKDSSHTSLTCS